ncbi:potassium/sodium hyperpolarization-activated cyclic nucleotide-gated channel 1-like [Sitophilus oryzae]|uniref:Potassium/sodium hyperpolarization-activated cyclic nucleotide-gated channel 1-like n=1 Tax=Sitophilus oryzae TaxID=7048 RepID=A0A6J2YP41_SITOR|nr:potassium/sodium hyperpolarization-activated cyclic nucleotide-gated channel 1-like [Sitophilus oryzae]
MDSRREDTKHHKCELQDGRDDIVTSFIDAGIFINIRRRLKRFMMISPSHPLTRFYIKSLCMFRSEEQRHLIKYYYMIHPMSMFVFVYRIYMSFILALNYFVWPIVVPYTPRHARNYLFMSIYPSYLVLIIVSFITGFPERNVHTIMMNPKSVSRAYLKSHFSTDVLSLVPPIIRFLTNKGVLNKKDVRLRTLRWVLPMLMYCRYNYFLETLKEVRLYTGFSNYLFLVIKSILNLISFIVVLTTIVYRILREFSVYKNKTAGEFAASVVQVVMMVSHGFHSSELLSDKLISILLVLCGFVIHLLVLVYTMEIWYKFYSCENMQNTVYDAVDAFIKYKALPVGKRKQIFLYLNFKYQRKFYKESTIVRITSDALRREVLVRISRESTQRVILFNRLPESILEKLRAGLSCEIYMPGDVIIKAGMLGRSMFFILAGTVVVKTPQGKEVCYLRDGAHFGEISLVVNVARVATVVVVTPCQVFRLNRRQFLSVVRHYPDLLRQIHTQALERYADTTTLHTDEPELTDRSELIQVIDPDVENRAPE